MECLLITIIWIREIPELTYQRDSNGKLPWQQYLEPQQIKKILKHIQLFVRNTEWAQNDNLY